MTATTKRSSIVTYVHRYKRPPREKKPVALKVPGGGAPAKSAIVTTRKRGNDALDLTPEEHQRRGDAAEAIFREMKRRIAATRLAADKHVFSRRLFWPPTGARRRSDRPRPAFRRTVLPIASLSRGMKRQRQAWGVFAVQDAVRRAGYFSGNSRARGASAAAWPAPRGLTPPLGPPGCARRRNGSVWWLGAPAAGGFWFVSMVDCAGWQAAGEKCVQHLRQSVSFSAGR
jgi:hypothetical protein